MSSPILQALGGEIQFSHKILYLKKEYELRVYSNGLAFLSEGNEEPKVFTWPVVLNISYSPATDPRTAVQMKTSVPGSESIILQLTGGSNEERLANLAKLKSLVSQLRKSSKSKSAEAESTQSTSSTPSSAPVSTTSASSSTPIENIDSIDKNVVEVIKKNLLKNNKELSKNYANLVTSNIITEEDFWMKNSEVILNYYNDEILYKKKKGINNNIWDDIVLKSNTPGGKTDGNITINLTTDLKMVIFKRYPKVKKIFDREVPLKMYEQKFWELFFRYEYYNINNKNSLASGLNMRENIFANYQEDEDLDDDKENREGEDGKKRKKELSQEEIENLSIKKKKLQYLSSHPEVDLTQTFHDSIAYKRTFEKDKPPGGGEKELELIKKFNEDSFFVSPIFYQSKEKEKEELTESVRKIVQPSSQDKDSDWRDSIREREGSMTSHLLSEHEDFNELLTGANEVYYKFNLASNLKGDTQNDNSNGFSSAFSSGFGFGSAVSNKYYLIKNPSLISLPDLSEENSKTVETEKEDVAKRANLLKNYLPKAARSEKFFLTDLPKVFRHQSISTYTGASAANKDSVMGDGTILTDPSLAIAKSFDVLPEDIKPVRSLSCLFIYIIP